METVQRSHDRRIPPTVRRTIPGIGPELGMLAAKTLQLRRQPAAIRLGLDDGVDALGHPIGPAVPAERGRVGGIGALDVRVLELADVAEDPLARQLGHGLLFDLVVEDGASADALEPAHVRDVGRGEGHPLRVHDDGARPEGDAVLAVDFRVFALHLAVEFRPQVEEGEGGAQDADAEVVVAREVGVVGHLDEHVQEAFESLGFVPVQCLQAEGALMVKCVSTPRLPGLPPRRAKKSSGSLVLVTSRNFPSWSMISSEST